MADFSDNLVNQRFRAVYEALEKRDLIKGKSDIGKKLETYNHVVNSILKGQRNITVDQILRLCEYYMVSADYLFGLSEEMFLVPSHGEIPEVSTNELKKGGRQNITLVPDRALAGYALEHQDATFMKDLPQFSIPNMEGSLVAFEISGDSMMPTITNGDIVVCQPVEREDPLRDNHVYVIVTDVVVAKRIQQLRDERNEVQRLRLISDNHAVYQPYMVDREEIRQILKVKCRVTSYAIS